MEKLPQKNEQPTSLDLLKRGTLEKLTANNFVSLLKRNQFKAARELMPNDPAKIEGIPVIKEMLLAGSNVAGFVEGELIRLSAMVNVSGNLVDPQPEIIAASLIRDYPNETVADFKICFEMGAAGKFGNIFRLDGIVIGEWVEKYISFKYQRLEDRLYEHKDQPYDIAKQDPKGAREWLDKWKQSISEVEDTKKIRALSADEIMKEGKEKKKTASLGFKPPSREFVYDHILHNQYIRENYELITGNPLSTWMPEKEWRENKLKTKSNKS